MITEPALSAVVDVLRQLRDLLNRLNLGDVAAQSAAAPTEFLTVRDVARELGISAGRCYDLIAPRGDLPAIRTQIGHGAKRRTRGLIRIRRADLERWVAERRSAPAAETQQAIERAITRQSISDLPGADRYAS